MPNRLVVKTEWDIASKGALAWFLIHSKHSMINNEFHSFFLQTELRRENKREFSIDMHLPKDEND